MRGARAVERSSESLGARQKGEGQGEGSAEMGARGAACLKHIFDSTPRRCESIQGIINYITYYKLRM